MNTAQRCFRVSCLAAALALLVPAASSATGYKITPISRAGAYNLVFSDINNAGLVTGYATNRDITELTGFVYNAHTREFIDLTGPAGAEKTAASGISDFGTVVGGYVRSSSTELRGFIYENGTYADFGVAGALYTELHGISGDSRYLTGTYYLDGEEAGNAFIFDRDTNVRTDISPNAAATVHGINIHGVAAGNTYGGGQAPFLYDVGTNMRTDYAPEFDRYRDINDSGIVTGIRYREESGGEVGLVGLPGSMSVLDVAGSRSTAGFGINNAGVVVGTYGLIDFSYQAFIATSVPEPRTWALTLCGLLGLTVTARRRERG